MSGYLIQPLRSDHNDLRLFQNTVLEENEQDMNTNGSISSSEENICESNEVASRSATPSLCIDEDLVNQHGPISVPPLELASRDSSLLTSNDLFKDNPDINLRSDSDEDVTSDCTQASTDPKLTQSQRWNELNARLQRLEPRSLKTDVKQTRTEKSVKKNAKEAESQNRFIYINEQLIGQMLIVPSPERLPKINYVKANKNVNSYQQKLPGYSYELLHQLKSPNGEHEKPLVNLLDPPLDVIRTRSKRRGKSETPLESLILPSVEDDSNQAKYGFSSEKSQKKIKRKCSKESKRATKKERRKSIPTCCLHPRETSQLNLRRNTFISHINPEHPRREYYVHSISALEGEQQTHSDLSQCTASGIYRLCMKQQAELVEAHKNFRYKHPHVSSVPIPTSLNLVNPNLGRSETSLSSYYKYRQKHMVPDPFKTRQLTQRSESLQSGLCQQRYTLRDYAILPKIPSQIRGLGPDLQSEQYKEKLTKRQRQKSYADRLREHSVPQRSRSHRTARLPSTDKEPIISSPNQPPKCTVIDFEENVSAQSELCEKKFNGTTIVMGTTNKTEGHSPLKSTELNVNCSHEKLQNKFETKHSASSSTIELTPEELERKKAADKRDAMLSYAKRIQTKMMDKRKRSQYEGSTNLRNSLRNENKTDESKCLNPNNERLLELLQRHEQDRKIAEAVGKMLKIEL